MIFGQSMLAGRTAFVAGGSSGINLGIAWGFARAGARVALISRSAERIATAADELCHAGHDAVGIAADVRDFDAVERALEQVQSKWGELDIILSGAAGNFIAPANTLSAKGFKTVVDIDLLGTFNVFRASYSFLKKPGASLIAITAGQSRQAMAGQIHACAAKAGVDMITRCLALEWANEGVRVNAVSPGPIAATEGMRRLAPTPEATAAFAAAVPLGYFGEMRDIADLCTYLASDVARYITGTIIDCDGGLSVAGGAPQIFHAAKD